MKCRLGKALGCEGLDKEGSCNVYYPVGVQIRMAAGICEFKNIRAPKIGIYELKAGKFRNPLKAAKAAERGKAAAEA